MQVSEWAAKGKQQEKVVKAYVMMAVKALLTAAFVAAGLAKLAGVQMMVDSFAALGLGQWFRYVTGVIEVGAAVLLWWPGRAAWGAGLLVCTMIGALLAHAVVLGMDTAGGAVVLGLLSALVLWDNRGQLRG